MLQIELPGSRPAAVAAAAVGEDLQRGGLAIAFAALGAPPLLDAVDGELGGVGGGADEDGSGIGLQVLDSVGDGATLGVGGEVVVAHQFGGAVPFGAGILERADEFLLLGVDADDRGVLGGAALAQRRDALELVVAVRMGGAGELLVVDTQREAQGP